MILVYLIKVGTFNKLFFFCLSKIDVDGISSCPKLKNALIIIALPAVKQNGWYTDYGYYLDCGGVIHNHYTSV